MRHLGPGLYDIENPRRGAMRVNRAFLIGSLLGSAIAAACLPAGLRAQQNPVQQSAAAPAIDDDDIGGIVTSRFGPEAGVWVIAETKDLGTRFAKIAVTDERGRYVIPDLPKVTYNVWVDRKSTRLNSSHLGISYAVFCLKKKNKTYHQCQ